jgi:RNA polymerase sigma-70 factor (ECF subfamily)
VQSAVLECILGLHAFATSLTRNRHQADDLVQDSITRALGAAGQFAPDTNFNAWIFTILRNLNCSEGRKRRARFSSLDELVADEPSVPASQEGKSRVLRLQAGVLAARRGPTRGPAFRGCQWAQL